LTMSARPARRRLRRIRSKMSVPIFVSATVFSVMRASSSPKLSRETTFSKARAVRASASPYRRLVSSSGLGWRSSAIPSPLSCGLSLLEQFPRARRVQIPDVASEVGLRLDQALEPVDSARVRELLLVARDRFERPLVHVEVSGPRL